MVGKQSGREIRPYLTQTGEELLFLYPGTRKPEEVFHFEHSQNRYVVSFSEHFKNKLTKPFHRLQTWLLRLLGWFVMFLGFNCMSNLLDIIGKTLFFIAARA